MRNLAGGSRTAWRCLTLAGALGVTVASVETRPVAQQRGDQEAARINGTIAALEEGRPAIANQEWRFIDMEHSPFSADRLISILAEMDADRDANGRLMLTPLVRIPQDGGGDFTWAVKQVLDAGAFGVVLPQVDSKNEAMRLVSAMRYPPLRDAPQPEPRGERGWGPSRAIRFWGVADDREYLRRADVWPLNPAGELFAVAMIESAEGVRNIREILEAPISAVLIAPNDLGFDLGLGPRRDQNFPEVDAAYQTVLDACLAQTAVVCGCADSGSRMEMRFEEGWRFFLSLGG